MINAIIFDIGNVICAFDNNLFITKISKHTNKKAQELITLLYEKPNLVKSYEMGATSSDEFFKKAVNLCNLKISKKVFNEAFTNIYSPITSTLELIRKLKKNYRLGLLSNTNDWDFKYLTKKYGIFNLFETFSLSYEVKAMKPNAKIYKDCLKKLELNSNECIYIDDIKKYSDKATELGIFGIHYTSHNKLIKSLELLGVKISI